MKHLYFARIFCAACLCVSGVGFSAHAQVTIEYSAAGDNIRNPDGSLAPVGEAVLLGTFPTGFDFSANQTFSSLSAAFTQFDSTTIGNGGFLAGQFDKSVVLNNPAFNNKQLYIWVFNNATPSSATAWAIVTNTASTWVVPPTAGDFTAIDASDIGVFVPVGAFGVGVPSSINNPGGNQTDWMMTMTAIPEPSSLALLGIGLGLIPLATLRRRRS
jgi:hypothetical protein